MGNIEQGSLSYHLLTFLCLAVIGSSNEFSTSLPSHVYHIAKASKCIHVLVMVRTEHPLQGSLNPSSRHLSCFWHLS